MQIAHLFIQFLALKNTQISHHKSELFKHDYSKFKEDNFLEDFNQTDFTFLDNRNININTKFDRYLYAPIKKWCRKELKLKDEPWILVKYKRL